MRKQGHQYLLIALLAVTAAATISGWATHCIQELIGKSSSGIHTISETSSSLG
ncbi:MAG: hypothetical protein K2X01_11820 [Cyanobacteria bacterium]|nr:hypothetical protein [Cyanobacteriota bacterium]